MKTKLFVILLCIVAIVAQGMPNDVAYKRYTPYFGDWVSVYLNTMRGQRTTDYLLYFIAQPTEDDELKILVVGRAQKTEGGRAFLYELMPKIRESLEVDCSGWRQEGYQIQFPDDFIFDVEYYE